MMQTFHFGRTAFLTLVVRATLLCLVLRQWTQTRVRASEVVQVREGADFWGVGYLAVETADKDRTAVVSALVEGYPTIEAKLATWAPLHRLPLWERVRPMLLTLAVIIAVGLIAAVIDL